jgi:hypothetical protein
VAGGVSIPLTVDALQQQIKQYVTACSGVEVKDIRVQIESSGEDAKESLYAIEAPTAKALPASQVKEEKAEEPKERKPFRKSLRKNWSRSRRKPLPLLKKKKSRKRRKNRRW